MQDLETMVLTEDKTIPQKLKMSNSLKARIRIAQQLSGGFDDKTLTEGE